MQLTNTALRSLQLFFTVLTLALSGALVAQQIEGGSPSIVNFAVFASIFSFIALFFTIGALFFEALAIPIAILVTDVLNVVFLFAGGVGLAHKLGVHSCGNEAYTTDNGITNGGGYPNPGKRCHEAQALTAFVWFNFGAYAVSMVFSLLAVKNSGGVASVRGGSSRMSVPSMSQV